MGRIRPDNGANPLHGKRLRGNFGKNPFRDGIPSLGLPGPKQARSGSEPRPSTAVAMDFSGMDTMDCVALPASTYFRAVDRAVDQLRPLRLTVDFIPTAEGSVLIELGHTRVLCNATVENGVPGWLRNRGQGWVTAEYGMLPRATLTRTARESERGKIGGRTHEIQRLIGRSLRAAVDLKALGERTIILDCDVLQADGGTRTAAITGAAVALGLAVNRLVASKVLSASPIRYLVAAASVGIVDGTALLDLAYEEDARADVDMNVVMTATGELIEVQATAERHTFSRQQHMELLELAAKGIGQLITQQMAALVSSH